ncbi:MAG: tetratricopeptide repeat protein [Kiritimatiellaeota bacterium]|nr:tetratricopeptide repeat protein [Kiritimatiellota bacterium]
MKHLEHRIGIAQGIAGALLAGIVLGAWQQVLDVLAGRTIHALLGFWGAAALGVAAGALVVCAVNRKARWNAGCAAGAFFLLGAWLVALLALSGTLQGGWHHLQLSAYRSFGMYAGMIAKTAGACVLVPSVLASCLVQGGQVGGRAERVAGWCCVALGYGAASCLCAYLPPEALTRNAAVAFGLLAGTAVLRKCGRLSGAWVFSAVLPFVLIVGLALGLLPGKQGNPLSADGRFGRLAYRDSGFGKGTPDAVFTAHGRVVTRYTDADYLFVGALDGRALLFGNRFAATRMSTGYAPLLACPRAESVALVGAECGVYLPLFLRAGVECVTVEAPPRLTEPFVAMDARSATNVLWQTKHKGYGPLRAKAIYSIIFVAPEPVWVRGSARVFSIDRLRRYRNALLDSGVVALRVDGRGLSEARFAAIVKDFMSVFTGVQVWSTGALDWVLLGGKREITEALGNVIDLFDNDAIFLDWVHAGNMGFSEMLASMVCDAQSLGAWLEGAGTEGAWAAAWRAPERVIAGKNVLATALAGAYQPRAAWLTRGGGGDRDAYDDVMLHVVKARHARTHALRMLAATVAGDQGETLAAARDAAAFTTHDALLLQMADRIDLEARRHIAIGNFKAALACFENIVSFSGATAHTHHSMGYCLRVTGDMENAYRHFARAVGAAPEQTAYRLDLGMAALAMGEYAEADRQYREVLKREPENAKALLLSAKALTASGRPDKDFDQAVRLAERAYELSGRKNDEIAYGLADIYIDAGRSLEGMGLKYRLQEESRK